MKASNITFNTEVPSSFDVLDLPIVHPTPEKGKRDYTPTTTSIEAMTKYGTKSSAIRGLKEEGKTVSEIADLLNIRYQHVRNVLNQVMKGK